MNAKMMKLTPFLFAGAAAAAIAAAPITGAQPAPPPPCVNADGTPCGSLGNVDAGTGGGANVAIPNGPVGTADGGGASGVIPNGPGGSADLGGASGSLSPVGTRRFGRAWRGQWMSPERRVHQHPSPGSPA